MATILVRTNPDMKKGVTGTVYECSICGSKYDTWDEAVACAEADYEKRTGRKPEPREA